MPAEEYPVGTFPASEATPAPEVSEKSLAELSELIKWPSKLEQFAAEPVPSYEPPAPEPVEQPIEPPAPEPAAEAAAPAAEPDKPAEPSQEDIEREILRAQVEAMEAHSKKLEAKLIGREAGEKGYIKQLQERLKRLESGNGEFREEPSPEPPPQEIVPATTDGFRTWAVQKAAQEALQGFMQNHSDVKEMEQEAMQYLQETGFDARKIYQLEDPIAAGREMTRVLEETYWHLRESRGRARVAELQIKKADQTRGLEEAKRRASPSASGSPPVPVTPPKTTKDLPLNDLDARVRAMRSRGR
jgi:acylphosphatase